MSIFTSVIYPAARFLTAEEARAVEARFNQEIRDMEISLRRSHQALHGYPEIRPLFGLTFKQVKDFLPTITNNHAQQLSWLAMYADGRARHQGLLYQRSLTSDRELQQAWDQAARARRILNVAIGVEPAPEIPDFIIFDYVVRRA